VTLSNFLFSPDALPLAQPATSLAF
jgi:hypothetical protein